MILDLSGADLGHEFKIVGGRYDGEHGQSLDYFSVIGDGEEFVDDFATMTAGHVRTDYGPIARYVPESMWCRQRPVGPQLP